MPLERMLGHRGIQWAWASATTGTGLIRTAHNTPATSAAIPSQVSPDGHSPRHS